MSPNHIFRFIALSGLLIVRGLDAYEMQDLDSIRAAAERTVRAQSSANPLDANTAMLTLEVAPLDPRLRVAACDRALSGFITSSTLVQARTTVGVRCEGSVRWTVYTSVNVATTTDVLVARRAMPRDTELGAGDFAVESRRVAGLASAYVSNPATLSGQRLGRAIGAGEPLTVLSLAPANIIHRGQQVTLLARVGGIEVRMAGVALADGHASERIKVQNQSSQRVIEGIVRSSNEIEIPL